MDSDKGVDLSKPSGIFHPNGIQGQLSILQFELVSCLLFMSPISSLWQVIHFNFGKVQYTVSNGLLEISKYQSPRLC